MLPLSVKLHKCHKKELKSKQRIIRFQKLIQAIHETSQIWQMQNEAIQVKQFNLIFFLLFEVFKKRNIFKNTSEAIRNCSLVNSIFLKHV